MYALDRLVESHPLLFRGAHPRVWSDLPDGWLPLVDELCTGIESILGQERCALFKVEQVKEKFGSLSFYFALDCASPAEMDAVRELVRTAEAASVVTCQKCGARGERDTRARWVATLCPTHVATRATKGSSDEL